MSLKTHAEIKGILAEAYNNNEITDKQLHHILQELDEIFLISPNNQQTRSEDNGN